ncbi:MAG: hypothetical protein PHE78_06245 [Candidatus Gastranaerophilales bacterium]|nr:hypothetical protein [Candidatus Gastranaerophilales bacterium]
MIPQISSGQDDSWLRKKLLERQANQAASGNTPNISSQTLEQNNGTSQTKDITPISGAASSQDKGKIMNDFLQTTGLNPQSSQGTEISAIGENASTMRTQATDPADFKHGSVAANVPNKSDESIQNQKAEAAYNRTGATQLGEYNKMLIKKKHPVHH